MAKAIGFALAACAAWGLLFYPVALWIYPWIGEWAIVVGTVGGAAVGKLAAMYGYYRWC